MKKTKEKQHDSRHHVRPKSKTSVMRACIAFSGVREVQKPRTQMILWSQSIECGLWSDLQVSSEDESVNTVLDPS